MLGAINLAAGQIARVVQGTGVEMVIDGVHPDTGRPITGTPIRDWESLTRASGRFCGEVVERIRDAG